MSTELFYTGKAHTSSEPLHFRRLPTRPVLHCHTTCKISFSRQLCYSPMLPPRFSCSVLLIFILLISDWFRLHYIWPWVTTDHHLVNLKSHPRICQGHTECKSSWISQGHWKYKVCHSVTATGETEKNLLEVLAVETRFRTGLPYYKYFKNF